MPSHIGAVAAGAGAKAEIPRLSVVIRYAAQNHNVNGILVLWRIVPEIRET
jgi:hypothetical protein